MIINFKDIPKGVTYEPVLNVNIDGYLKEIKIGTIFNKIEYENEFEKYSGWAKVRGIHDTCFYIRKDKEDREPITWVGFNDIKSIEIVEDKENEQRL